ncbi:helix-turn-helix domain-containing protein [Neoaquamicrobium sediminum]|uniref:helix-turn-helix domain-containing protein n=1 Tax=Neoaquamicrobium sediminum TaxID=1849104 RepID=UPI0028A58335|nr:helix-turn-helix domain-containing protein [Mesorhizobium sediminum]
MEAGRQNATLDTLAALAKALDVEPKDLITATAPKRHTGRSTKQPARGSRN